MSNFEQYIEFFRQYNVTVDDLTELKNFSFVFKSSDTNEDTVCYCNGFLTYLALTYKLYHVYIALIVCLFGILSNILNIIVLTQKEMMRNSINKILTGLALADMLVMIDYIPFAIYIYLILPRYKIFPYGWAVYIFFHMHISQISHTISIALTITLAVWRYIALRFMQNNHAWCTPTRCKIALSCCVFVPLIVCAPSYFVFGIKNEHIFENGTSHILYHVDTDHSISGGFLYHLNFWILGVVVKLFPCIILTVITCWLIQTLYRTKEQRETLKNYNRPVVKNLNGLIIRRKPSKNEKHNGRTTKMLIVVLLLFLITELPHGVLHLLSGILGDCFFRNCYLNFGEIMDILMLLNGTINFILYCLMSRQFRTLFGRLFKPKIMRTRQTTARLTDIQTTHHL